jgi:plasmid stabilization system protein ParE
MSLYRLTPKAKTDLRSIWSYIAVDNVKAADRVEEAIYDACVFLAKSPLRGHPRKDLTKLPVRFWTVPRYPKYVIVYDPAEQVRQGKRGKVTVGRVCASTRARSKTWCRRS